jgi:DNA-binding GntR family transcriptional regulator
MSMGKPDGYEAALESAAASPGEAAALSDQAIYEQLLDAIIEQRLAPHTKLVEDQLAQFFGVSRTRIRPALVRLAAQRIVTLTPNRGARVAWPDVREAQEVFETRRLIEPRLLELFMQQPTAIGLSCLEACIDAEEAAQREGDRQRAISCSGDFHLWIARHAGHETLLRILQELVSRTSLVLMSWGRPEASALAAQLPQSCHCHEHRSLLEAIRAGDVGLAQQLMTTHLNHIEAGLDFARSSTPVPPLLAALKPF